MSDEQNAQATPEQAPAVPEIPAEVQKKLERLDSLERQNKDFIAEIKKLKGTSKAAEESAKTAEQLAVEKRRERAAANVWRALAIEGVRIKDEHAGIVESAILSATQIEDDGSVKGVGDAVKTLREIFGAAAPEPAKPEASPSMAKPKANAAPVDPKFANVTTLPDLIKLGVESFNEFKSKYPDRFAALGRNK